jgi:hypothetical protein
MNVPSAPFVLIRMSLKFVHRSLFHSAACLTVCVWCAFECGFTPDCCDIQSQSNGFLTTALFTEWFFAIHISDAREQRQRSGYAGIVFLILDEFAGHVTDAIEDVCVCYGIRMFTIPSHISDQVQPLDLGLSAFHKSENRRVQPHLDLNAQTTNLIRMLCGFQKAATPVNVSSSFPRA